MFSIWGHPNPIVVGSEKETGLDLYYNRWTEAPKLFFLSKQHKVICTAEKAEGLGPTTDP